MTATTDKNGGAGVGAGAALTGEEPRPMTETVVDLSAPEAPTMTTDEANRLATGLVGAAAAEREEAPRRAPGSARVGSADVFLDGAVAAEARRYTPDASISGGWVRIGPLHVHGTWDDLADFFAAGLAAVREQSTGPVGG